jgi:hypothetical protein
MPALTRYADGGDIVAQEAKKEIEKLRDLFEKVQDHCAGDAHPRWGRDPATTNSRGYLLDICNSALD